MADMPDLDSNEFFNQKEEKESEPQTKVPDDLVNDVDRPQT